MNRRLNPDLFGPKSSVEDLKDQSYSAVATRRLEGELKQTKKKVSELESMIEVMQAQMNNLTSNTERRSDAFSKAINELEKDFRDFSLKQNAHKNRLEERLRDQRVKDEQMEAIIERYNNTLQNFENRLSVVQKVIADKEMNLMSYREIIEKIVEEVEALKDNLHHRQPPQQHL